MPEAAHDNADINPVPSAHGQIEGIGVAPRLRASMADGHVVADEVACPVSQVADHDAAFRLVRLVLSIGLRDNSAGGGRPPCRAWRQRLLRRPYASTTTSSHGSKR
ncbi:hypothetical protein ACTMU2_23930 [Cupriavidus basilensis]